MSNMQVQRRRQARIARLEIVSKLYLRQMTVRQIRAEVMKRLNLDTYSTQTVQRDIQTLLDEWRQSRLDNMDDALQLELERIDEACRELWEQWEKSKQDGVITENKRKGTPVYGSDNKVSSRVTSVENKESSRPGLGNVAYIVEIRQQLQERRRLLGLYAPDKKEISGEMSFASMLMESGIVESEEEARIVDEIGDDAE